MSCALNRSVAIVPTNEPTAESKRHPWACSWRKEAGGRCGWINRAKDHHCRRCGRPYAPEHQRQYAQGTDLSERVTVADAVAEYLELAESVREHFEQLREIEQRLGVLFGAKGPLDDEPAAIDLHSRNHDRPISFADPDEALANAEREIWQVLTVRSGVQRITSNKRWEEMQDQLYKGKLPPLTPENVAAWTEQTISDAEGILREKVTEVFDWLRPRSDHFRTNTQFEIGKKVVLEYMIGRAEPRCGWAPRVSYTRRQMLSSMESLFKTLDGKGVATNGWQSDLQIAIEASASEDAHGETEYFKFRAFRNGNMHLEFKRPDLVSRLNALAGGKNLRGAR